MDRYQTNALEAIGTDSIVRCKQPCDCGNKHDFDDFG